eukprot:g1837.t1
MLVLSLQRGLNQCHRFFTSNASIRGATPEVLNALNLACDDIVEKKSVADVLRQLRSSAPFQEEELSAGEGRKELASLFATRLVRRAEELVPNTFAELHSDTDLKGSDGEFVEEDVLSADVLHTKLNVLWPEPARVSFRSCSDALALSHASLKLHFATLGMDSSTGALDLELSEDIQKTPIGKRILRKNTKSKKKGRKKKSNLLESEAKNISEDVAYLWGPRSHAAAICCEQLDLLNSASTDNSDAADIKSALTLVGEVSERRALTGPLHYVLYPWLVQWAQGRLRGGDVDEETVKSVMGAFDVVNSNLQMRAELGDTDYDTTKRAEELRVWAGVRQRASVEGLIALVRLADAVCGTKLMKEDERDVFRKALLNMIEEETQDSDLAEVRIWAKEKFE